MKPHIVLIPGAWHSADCYDTLLPFLQNEGYKVTALTLPSVGAEPPLTTLEPEVAHIRNSIFPLLDAGEDVVVVMHSYAGMAGSASLKGLSKTERRASNQLGGVVALVYVAAWMLDEGQSIRASGGGRGGKAGPSKIREDGDYIYHLDPIPALYQDVDPDLAKKCASSLKHHSLPTLYVPLPYAAWRHIPTTYLLCTEDQTIPYDRQVDVVEHARKTSKIKTFECNSGHSPFLSQPELTARVIRHAAGEDIQVVV